MNRRSGFTLIEVILATLIFAMIGTLTYGALSSTFRTERTITARTQLQQIGTAAIAKIQDDLSQIFLVEAARQATYFKGEDNFDKSKMSFTAFAHDRSAPEAHESDQAEITYDVENDPADPRSYRLRRRENRYLGHPDRDMGDTVVLATRVAGFNVEYGDGQSYRANWDTRSEETRNRLPNSVKVSLKVKDAHEREETFESVVEIPMAENLGLSRPQQQQQGQSGQTSGGATGQQQGKAGQNPLGTPGGAKP